MNKNEKLAVIPQVTLPTGLYEYLKLMSEDLHPMRPLLPPHKQHSVLSSDRETQRLIREVGTPLSARPEEEEAVVEYWLRFDQMTDERVDAYIEVIRDFGPSAWIEVQEESICRDRSGQENFGNYRLLFHIPNERMLRKIVAAQQQQQQRRRIRR